MAKESLAQKNDRFALILSGGGARGAYEAGIINFIRNGLPRPYCDFNFPIQCGSSVGAINASYLASNAHRTEQQGDELVRLWKELKQEDVYLRNFKALGNFIGNSVSGIGRNLTRLNPFKDGMEKGQHFRSVFNTEPFHEFLKKNLVWKNIAINNKKGLFKVFCLVGTRMRTGRTELFVQKKPDLNYIGPYTIHEVNIDYRHAMASAAIPFIFPSVPINGHHYVDGGVRLNTPLSPAVQFGANKLFVISLHSNKMDRVQAAADLNHKNTDPAPSLGEYLGKMLNGMFLDRLDYDLEQTKRINQIIDRSVEVFGPDYLKKINAGLHKDLRTGKKVKRNFRPIRYFTIAPSVPISDVFMDWYFNIRRGKPHFTNLEKMLLRVFDINTESSLDLLSYLVFAQEYIKMLLDLGYKDAQERKDEIIDFFDTQVD